MRKQRGVRFRLIQGFLGVLAVLMLLPMLQTFLYSFSSISEMKSYMGTRGSFDESRWMDPHLIPNMFSLGQYHQILITDNTVLRLFVNSAMYAAMILAGQAIIIPAMAFGLSRFHFPGRNAAFFGIILLMLLPFQVTMVPNVLTLRSLGLTDTIWAVVLPMWFAPFYIFLIRQFVKTVPRELDEAATIDGCGFFRILLFIIVPAIKSAMIVVGLLKFIELWNDLLQQVTYITRRDRYTLALGLNIFRGSFNDDWSSIMCATCLSFIPGIVFYLIGQRYFVEGIVMTGMKN